LSKKSKNLESRGYGEIRGFSHGGARREERGQYRYYSGNPARAEIDVSRAAGHEAECPSQQGSVAAAGCSRCEKEIVVARLFQREQRCSVCLPISAARGDSDVIAAILAFLANAIREPPCSGMKEEQGLDDTLEHIREKIVTPDVRELVSE
jgi:hypothetical protein